MALINDLERLGNILLRGKLVNSEQLSGIAKELKSESEWRRKKGIKKKPEPLFPYFEKLEPEPGKESLTEDLIMKAVAAHYNLEFKKLDPLDLDSDAVTGTLPKPFALKHAIVPLFKNGGSLTLALTDPEQAEAIEQVRMVSEMEIKLVIATHADIVKIINQFFSFSKTIKQAEENVIHPKADIGNLEQLAHIKSEDDITSSDQHIQDAVDSLLRDALANRSSDIHIEPKRDETVVRNRIDGVLADTHRMPRIVHSAILSRIKLLSRMDISEKRRPQDGRIKVKDKDKEVEMRVSVLPTAFGEKAVIRIFDYEIAYTDLDALGFNSKELKTYKSFLKRPHGITLVTGPTGSGKTSALYSSLKFLSSPEKNIVTIEDPIEMIVPEFNQVGVQTSIDLTFASALRSILRQDPDIIMIGEIRDTETAQNAVKAALTGHLVISTLHTNDTVSSLTRLYDLGVEPYLVKTSLIGILSQRLARVICDKCKTEFVYPPEALAAVGIKGKLELTVFKGEGCQKCRATGYFGRKGVHEILEISGDIRRLIDGKTPEEKIIETARKAGMKTIQENALKLFLKGETTLEEALKLYSNLN